MGDLIIIGASGHARVALDVALAAGGRVVGFVDRAFDPGKLVDGVPVLAREPEDCRELRGTDTDWFVAIGDNRMREELFARMRACTGREPANVVHPSAVLSPRIDLGRGVFVGPGAIVNTGARLADGTILNTAASLDHDDVLEAFAQVSPGCHLAGNVTVGQRGFLGTGSSVIPGISIGADAVIGAGAVVVHDVPAGVLALGVPARVRPRR